MADLNVATEVKTTDEQKDRKKQSSAYSQRVSAVEDKVLAINTRDLVGDVIFVAFSPIQTSNIASLVMDGPIVGLPHVSDAITKFIVDILAANRGRDDAANNMQKSIDATKNEDNITFLKTVLEKAVVDGNLGRNTKDAIMKSVTEASGKRTGSCLGDRSIFGPYYSYYFKSILPFSRLSGTAGEKKSRNKRPAGKKSRPFTARASGGPSSVGGDVAGDDGGETFFHGRTMDHVYQLPLLY